MPFESLSERIQMSLRRVTGRGRLTENDIDEMMREIRLSLLEADVNYKVVKNFTAEVKQKAMGEKIMKSLTPGDQVVKVVHEELKRLMGDETSEVNYKKDGISVFALVGLQGSGKTTHCGKLANLLRKKDAKKPLLIAADVYRPAAINQLVTIG
ncbi:MAG: signal recognition particle protein, partial [Erysipelotrichia bacterium]|nr:signal recognition particle protein [Erysipelotrichia bacterium]